MNNSKFNLNMSTADKILGFLKNGSNAAAIIEESLKGNSATESIYTTGFTGTELLRNPRGKVSGVGVTTETIYETNLTPTQKTAIENRVSSDSLQYNLEAQKRGDSLCRSMK